MLAIVSLCLPASAQSEPRDSKRLAQLRFQEGMAAYGAGRFAAAASLFEAADRLAPRAATRYNAAASWEAAGESARAATGYEAALGMVGLGSERTQEAGSRLATLRTQLARVRISKPLGALVTVDHVQSAPVPTTFFLRPGEYDLTVEYRGERSTISASLVEGADRELELDLPNEGVEVGGAAPAPATPEPAVPEPARAVPVQASDSRRTWGWVGVGAGVALSAVAVVLGVRALSARDRYVDSGDTDAAALNEAENLRLATNVAWGGAGVVGITGLVLVLTTPSIEF